MLQMKLCRCLVVLVGLLIAVPVWAAPTSTKITIHNKSGYPDTQIYLVVYGKTPIFARLNWTTGALIPCSTADNTVLVTRKDGTSEYYCNYWVTLDRIKKEDGTYSFTCPPIVSGRLFLSFLKPVYLHINDGPAVAEPSTDNTNDPSYDTLWDKFEWTLDGGGLHANTTPIDFFAMPLQFSMKDSGGSETGPRGFSRSNFPSNYFEPYVNYVWTTCWQNFGSLKVAAGGYNWTGQIAGDVLTMTVDGMGETHTINRPTKSWDIFACAGVFDHDTDNFPKPPPDSRIAPYDRDGAIRNEICSALNRSVMHLPTASWSVPANYYKNPSPQVPADIFKTNIYSKTLHEVAIGNLIYGFPYDDKYDQASYLTNPYGTELILTINNCKGGVGSGMFNLLLGD